MEEEVKETESVAEGKMFIVPPVLAEEHWDTLEALTITLQGVLEEFRDFHEDFAQAQQDQNDLIYDLLVEFQRMNNCIEGVKRIRESDRSESQWSLEKGEDVKMREEGPSVL